MLRQAIQQFFHFSCIFFKSHIRINANHNPFGINGWSIFRDLI